MSSSTITTAASYRIEVLQIWTLRWLLRIPWTAYIRHEEVLRHSGIESQKANCWIR